MCRRGKSRMAWKSERAMRLTPTVQTPLFPIFLRLEKRACLVVGGGKVAEEKILGLLAAKARVRVIAPKATVRIQRLAHERILAWRARRFRESDVAGAFLVVAATSSSRVHEQIRHAVRRAKVICNVVDDPARCDFYYGAVVRRGALQIAISTGGCSPALAQQLRQQLAKQFGPEYGRWVTQLGRERRRARATEPDSARRKNIAHEMVRRGIRAKSIRKNQRKRAVAEQ